VMVDGEGGKEEQTENRGKERDDRGCGSHRASFMERWNCL